MNPSESPTAKASMQLTPGLDPRVPRIVVAPNEVVPTLGVKKMEAPFSDKHYTPETAAEIQAEMLRRLQEYPGEARLERTRSRYLALCDEVKSILLEKNAKYGGSAFNPLRCFSQLGAVAGILVRMDDKLSRIATSGFSSAEGRITDEDTLKDLAGYAVLAYLAYRHPELAAADPEITRAALRQVLDWAALEFPEQEYATLEAAGTGQLPLERIRELAKGLTGEDKEVSGIRIGKYARLIRLLLATLAYAESAEEEA